MRPHVIATLRTALFLIALCVLVVTQANIAWADDSLPPIPSIPEPILEPVAQWGDSAPSVGLSSVLLPEQMPTSWTSSQLALPALAKIPRLDLPGAELQPVAQWTKFDWPQVQSIVPRTIDFPATGMAWDAYQSPASVSTEWLARTATNAASSAAMWKSEGQLLQRDVAIATQRYLDAGLLALNAANPVAWVKYAISWMPAEWLKTGTAAAFISRDLATGQWGSALTGVGHWSLDHSILQTFSAQSISGPFVQTVNFSDHWQDSYMNVYSQGTVQVTLQPGFPQNPTRWLTFPDSYVETTTTHWAMTEHYGYAAPLTSSYVPQTYFPPPPTYSWSSFSWTPLPSFNWTSSSFSNWP